MTRRRRFNIQAWAVGVLGTTAFVSSVASLPILVAVGIGLVVGFLLAKANPP